MANLKCEEPIIEDFQNLDAQVQKLILSAINVRKTAYCPYSNFAVGAAIRVPSGDIVTGCNIENTSYGASMCAERGAVSKMFTLGHREISAIAIVAYQENVFTTPCGICRQVLIEFATEDVKVYLAKPEPEKSGVLISTIFNLLPLNFKI